MRTMSNEKRIKALKIFLCINGVILLFWWPLSHWFYPDVYHNLLGFKIGSYPDNLVKIIGTCGFIPVLLFFFSAIDPLKNRDSIITLIIFAVLISLTYVYLIIRKGFPVLEYINVGLSVSVALFLILFYPWKQK